jgi:hypothetical protein
MCLTVDESVSFRLGGRHATWNSTTIPIAHMGCKTLAKLLEPYKGDTKKTVRARFDQLFPAGWDNPNDGKRRLATAIAQSVEMTHRSYPPDCHLQGAVFWDTMRKGSDYWRPGKLLTEVAEIIRQEHGLQASYQRDDTICPPLELLDEFVSDNAMPFGGYAQGYAQHLRQEGILEAVAVEVVANLASGRLPVFYCVDPYIPGYVDKSQVMSSTPYDRRQWSSEPALREGGCHRVILVEELAKYLTTYGISIQLLAIDPTFSKCHTTFFSS